MNAPVSYRMCVSSASPAQTIRSAAPIRRSVILRRTFREPATGRYRPCTKRFRPRLPC